MNKNALIEVVAGQWSGYQGYLLEEHPNLPGWYWCRISKSKPFPRPGDTKKSHHHDKVVKPAQLQTL